MELDLSQNIFVLCQYPTQYWIYLLFHPMPCIIPARSIVQDHRQTYQQCNFLIIFKILNCGCCTELRADASAIAVSMAIQNSKTRYLAAAIAVGRLHVAI